MQRSNSVLNWLWCFDLDKHLCKMWPLIYWSVFFFHCKYRRKGKKPSSASLFLKVMDRNCKILCRFGANTLEKSVHKRSQYSHCCSRKNSKKTSQLLGLDLGTQGWILPPGIMSMPLHYCRHTPFVGMGNSSCTRKELCCTACSVPRGYSQGTHICK